MRNLKRTLSLALAAIMLVGMMVVSASAASYNNLTDKDEIVNKDAVSMLVSLGIIEGKPDGSYGPTEKESRRPPSPAHRLACAGSGPAVRDEQL